MSTYVQIICNKEKTFESLESIIFSIFDCTQKVINLHIMNNILRITVEPHVGVYLRFHFGERMSLSDKNIVSLTLLPLLMPFDKLDPFQLKNQRKESLGDFYEVYISDNILKKYGGHLTNESIIGFNESIDLLIKQEMYRWCQHPNAHHKEVDYNIKRFINYYEFAEDDLTFDNLKRWYYRERQRIAKRKEKSPEKSEGYVIPAMLTYLPEMAKSNNQIRLFS